MKPDLIITIKGRCSETKQDIAEALMSTFIKRGYGTVFITGADDGLFVDGLSEDENVEIRIK